MKKIIILVSLLVLSIGLLSGCGVSDDASKGGDLSLENIKEDGVIVLGLDDSFPPMGFRDSDGNVVGFDIDLAKEVASRMGVELEIKPIDWDAKVLELNNKNIDLIWNGLTITEEREKQINFSKAYLKNRQIIITKSESLIDSKEDLKDKVVGLQLGSSSEDALNSQPDIVKSLKDITKYGNNTEALMDLEAGRVDAVVVDEIVGRYYIGKKPDIYKVAKDDFGVESYGIGFRKGEDKLRDEVDRILDEMSEDGTIDEISKKWFGENIVIR